MENVKVSKFQTVLYYLQGFSYCSKKGYPISEDKYKKDFYNLFQAGKGMCMHIFMYACTRTHMHAHTHLFFKKFGF